MTNKTDTGTTGNFAPEAYNLVLEALAATVKYLKSGKIKPLERDNSRGGPGHPGAFHVGGRELLEGFRLHVNAQFGKMARFMLRRWGLNRTEDVGRIVFEMVEDGRMSRRDNDSIDDFRNGYDFDEAFGGEGD